jgi:hypothetical protein
MSSGVVPQQAADDARAGGSPFRRRGSESGRGPSRIQLFATASQVEPTFGYTSSGSHRANARQQGGMWTGGEQFTPDRDDARDEAASAAASANGVPSLMCTRRNS